MALDPSIILAGAQSAPQPFGMNSIAQLMQMKQAQTQMRQQEAVRNSLAAIYANPANLGPDGMPNAQAMAQISRVSPEAAQKMMLTRATLDEKRALTSHHQATAGLDAQKTIQSMVRDPALNAYDQALAGGKSPQEATAIAQRIYSDGLESLFQGGYVPDAMKAQVPMNFDPVRVRANSLSYKDQQALNEKRTADERADRRIDTQTDIAKARLGMEGERLGIERERLARTVAQDTAGGGGGMSEAAIDAAAARYNVDGTLPPMGMGKAGMNLRTEILNRAAALSSGKDATEQRISQIANKADATALTQLRRQQTAGENFEKTAMKNADLALKASEAMSRTGVTAFNAWLQAGRRAAGSTEAANFDAANNSFVEEYAKVMTGSTGGAAATDSARARAHELLSTAMTQEQYRSNMEILKKEMRNRVDSYKEQADETQDRIRASSKPSNAPKTISWDEL